jgi:hypothetical protein
VSRPRGFTDWQPRAESRALLEQVEAVLDEYRAYLPLTCRTIFYRLVGAHGFEKTDKNYARLLGVIANARRARLLRFEAISDDKTNITTPWADYDSNLVDRAYVDRSDEDQAERFRRVLRAQLDDAQERHATFWERAQVEYNAFWPNFWSRRLMDTGRLLFDRLDAQPRRIEVWVEAAGMVPLVQRAVRGAYRLGETASGIATVYSSGGFDSLTEKYFAAYRIADHSEPTIVLYVGDYDPSGESMLDVIRGDVGAFADELGGQVEFCRLAVTPTQAVEYDLPSAPPNPNDKRSAWSGNETWQAEALPPDLLIQIVREGVANYFDENAERQLVERERSLRDRLVAAVEAERRQHEEEP